MLDYEKLKTILYISVQSLNFYHKLNFCRGQNEESWIIISVRFGGFPKYILEDLTGKVDFLRLFELIINGQGQRQTETLKSRHRTS